MGCLYQLTFPGGKQYIGITKHNANYRFNAHVKHAIAGKRIGAIHHAINKYGKESVVIKTLLIADFQYLKLIEPEAIFAFSSKFPSGYNLTDGGEGTSGVVRSDETKKKISAAKVGKTLSAESRAKVSAFNKGKIFSDDTRAKISQACREKWDERKIAARIPEYKAGGF